ncbi:MAG: hypothetical protein Q8Q62_09210 [Mesorhizobium sp.]|nr:hypothetical protein [Mesorhizobium sp.]
MRPLALLLAGVFAAATLPAIAAPPGLAAYVTDENEDAYVALYGNVAIELSGCASEAAARALVAVPSAAIEQTTLVELRNAHDLGHPKIPCSPDARFDADFPATTPVWFDLDGTRRYYLSWPTPHGTFYSVPSRCTAIKEAFALRQRIALPGVLKGETAPPQGAIVNEIVLDCGEGQPAPGEPGEGDATALGDRWSLHQTDVFLSETSVGDTVYVAVFNRVTPNGIEKSYLPIHRINGAPSGQAVWEGSNSRGRVEAALAELFGTDPTLPVTMLGFQDVARLDAAVYLDLCLTRCQGYRHEHGFFPQPGQAFDLVTLPPPLATQRLGLLGETIYRWNFAQARSASFVGCGGLAAAIGMVLPAADASAWGDAVDNAIGAPAEKPFVCAPRDELCRRVVAEGGVVSQAHFNRGSDCQTARRLRLELPKQAVIASTLRLDANGFADVEIVPRDPVGRSRLRVTLPIVAAAASSCPFEPAPAILSARDLSALRLSRLDIVRSADGPTQELTAMVLENVRVALDHVAIGAGGEGLRPIERTLRLCGAEVYALGGSYLSSLLGLHGLNSRISVAGLDATDLATIGSGSFGLFMMSGSTVRMSWAAVTAPRAVSLRASDLKGTRVDLAVGQASPTSSGLRLERGASAQFSLSSARGFACLGVFPDPSSSARFTLPVNALAADNTRTNCGSGSVEIID